MNWDTMDDNPLEHEEEEGDEMQACQRSRQSLVVAHQPPKACHPGKIALHHPATWQQDEAPFRLRQPNNFDCDPVYP